MTLPFGGSILVDLINNNTLNAVGMTDDVRNLSCLRHFISLFDIFLPMFSLYEAV